MVTVALMALPAQMHANALSPQCLTGNVLTCESSEESFTPNDTSVRSELTFEARADLPGPMTVIDRPSVSDTVAATSAGGFVQIAVALERSSTPQAVLDVLTSGAWHSGLRMASMDYGDGIGDPLASSPQTPAANPTPVPEPASLLLFGSGLAGLAGLARRLRRRKSGIGGGSAAV